MNELINEQISLVLEDLNLMTNPYERSMVRVNLIKALTDLSPISEEEVSGKDAIKTDYAKATSEQSVQEEVVQPEETIIEETVEKLEPNEIDLDKSVVSNEPVIATMEDEEGNTFEIDVTEAYEKLSEELSEEDRIELAKNITAYNLAPIYDELAQLPDCNDKMMLSYYLQQLGLDEVNGFISQLTDGRINLLHEFVNKDNLEYLVNEITTAMED